MKLSIAASLLDTALQQLHNHLALQIMNRTLFLLLVVQPTLHTSKGFVINDHQNIIGDRQKERVQSHLQISTSSSLSVNENQKSEKEEPQETTNNNNDLESIFQKFASFLETKQNEIIQQIEEKDGSGKTFCRDTWGRYDIDIASDSSIKDSISISPSGGITRVIQGGNVVEKGACSLTLLKGGKLTAERAAAIRGRQDTTEAQKIKQGDEYSAAALSMVLHTRSPMVPTFRSDVRIFMVKPSDGSDTMAWFGGMFSININICRFDSVSVHRESSLFHSFLHFRRSRLDTLLPLQRGCNLLS